MGFNIDFLVDKYSREANLIIMKMAMALRDNTVVINIRINWHHLNIRKI